MLNASKFFHYWVRSYKMSDNDMELLRSTLLKYMDIHEAKNVISQPSLDLEDLCRFMPADAAKVVCQIQSQRTIEPVFDGVNTFCSFIH